jgi:hypothetical protein
MNDGEKIDEILAGWALDARNAKRADNLDSADSPSGIPPAESSSSDDTASTPATSETTERADGPQVETPTPSISPEYQELHALYMRCLVIAEGLQLQAPAHPDSPLLAQLIMEYTRIANDVATLVILLQRHGPVEPAVLEAWKEIAR